MPAVRDVRGIISSVSNKASNGSDGGFLMFLLKQKRSYNNVFFILLEF